MEGSDHHQRHFPHRWPSLGFGPEVEAIIEDESSLDTRWRYFLRYLQVRTVRSLSRSPVKKISIILLIKYFDKSFFKILVKKLRVSRMFTYRHFPQGCLNQDIDNFENSLTLEEEGRSVVVMTFHPAVTDTTGAFYLAKQFMELLDVKLENDGPLSVSEQQDIPE